MDNQKLVHLVDFTVPAADRRIVQADIDVRAPAYYHGPILNGRLPLWGAGASECQERFHCVTPTVLDCISE
jgi:hypothetical protein